MLMFFIMIMFYSFVIQLSAMPLKSLSWNIKDLKLKLIGWRKIYRLELDLAMNGWFLLWTFLFTMVQISSTQIWEDYVMNK